MHPDPDPVIQVQALLAGDDDTIAAKARELRATPGACRTVKLKVGDVGADAAARRVALVAGSLGPDWRLRLDANRAWEFDEAEAFWRQVREWPIEYVEEPLRDWARLRELRTTCGARYALDETPREENPVIDGILDGASALVHKPTMMRLEDMPETERDIPICVSASFESGVGIAALASLAFVSDPDQPAGLDTYAWLAEDVLEERLPLAPGLVNIEDLAAAARRVDLSKLERIA
jgi:o-succinylbenzoate synthase